MTPHVTRRRFRDAALTCATFAAVAAVCVACSSPAGVGEPTGTASYISVATGGDGAQTSALPPGMTDSWTVPAPTTSATGAALPGGTGDIAALVAAGDLVGDGLIDLRGQGIPKDGGLANPAATANLCGYLFGAPGQVAETARLTGDITLDPISGRHASGSAVGSTSALTTEPGTGTGTTASTGTGTAEATDTRTMATPASAAAPVLIACVYRSDGAPVLVLQIGNGPPIDPDLPGKPIIVDGTGGLQAVLSYSPQHQGATIAPATARDWLSAAIGRVAPI